MAISVTKLRADLYRVIDGVIKNGTAVEVELRGKRVRIVPAEPADKLSKLQKRPGAIVGDPARLPHARAFDEPKWRKKWGRRLK